MNAKQIKESNKIIDFLTTEGYSIEQNNKRSVMIKSPFRNENTPSFKIDKIYNIWFDYGSGEGGNIFDLVCKLKNLSFKEALYYLHEKSFFLSTAKENIVIADEKKKEKESFIISTSEITNQNLLSYAASRKISKNLLIKYCKEIHYNNNGKPYYAIGFKNEIGGYELRSKYFKGCIGGKHYTYLQSIQVSKDLYVFEGFFDFLSYQALYNLVDQNYLILNSLNCIKKAIEVIKEAITVHSFLNNDIAGFNGLEKIKAINYNVIPENNIYKHMNDLNQFLVNISE